MRKLSDLLLKYFFIDHNVFIFVSTGNSILSSAAGFTPTKKNSHMCSNCLQLSVSTGRTEEENIRPSEVVVQSVAMVTDVHDAL